MKLAKTILLATLSTLALAACNSGNEPSDTPANDTTVVAEETAATDPMATGAAGTQNVVALAQGNPDVSTLVSAVTAADLGETLSGPGPFTIIAPTNAAFNKVDKATLDGLMKPESKAKLGDILKYHVISGNIKSADLAKQIKDGNGTATVKTLNGGNLKASMDGDKIVLTDAKGGKATVTAADMMASNGTVHVVDSVLMP